MNNTRLRILLIIIISIIHIDNGIGQDNVWSTNGPSGGSVFTIEINPVDHQVIFVGTIQNGIYKTLDGGQHWLHLNNDDIFSTMRDMAIHPLGPDTMYAATTEGLYKSIDGGQSWDFVWLPENPYNEICAVKYHPEQPQLIIAGGPINIWKSSDGGNSWEELDVLDWTGITDIAFDPQNPDIIYFIENSMTTGHGIWKSIDRGRTWINIQNNIPLSGFPTDIVIDPNNTSTLYISMNNYYEPSNASLYKSLDSGNNWIDISPDGLTIPYICSIAIAPNDHNTIYAGTSDDGVFKSEDAGETWESFNSGLKILQIATIEVDILNRIIYLGTFYDGIYKKCSEDNTWLKISDNINITSCLGIDICSNDYSHVFVAAINGLFETDDMGESWRYIDVGMPLHDSPNGVVIDKYYNNIIYLSSGHQITSPSLDYGFFISFDGGENWTCRNDGLPDDYSYNDIDISYINDDTKRIFLISSNGVFYSDNVGENWHLCDRDLPSDAWYTEIVVAVSDQKTIAVGDELNRIFISHNRGESWHQATELTDNPNGKYIFELAFNPIDENHIYASSTSHGLFESIDSGESWNNINNNLPLDQYVQIVSGIAINPYNPSNIFVGSNHYGIFKSHNGGQTWESFNEGMDTTDGVGKMMFAPGDTTRLYFASSMRSVWSITRTGTGVDDAITGLPEQLELSAYPNPFNASAKISFSLPTSGAVRGDIYDLLGRHVTTLIDDYMPAGYHMTIWNPKELSSGVYIYKLQAGEHTKTKKMLLIK